MKLSPLLCKIQSYAWGSRSFIATMQGRPAPTHTPEAELWIGAHPSSPAEVELVPGEARTRLDSLIAAAPDRLLGPAVADRFDHELPFLMKVLAAAEPLSLQAHPSRDQAEHGFAREQAAGIPLGAPERSYKDPRPKPELIVALTPFVALSGFRRLELTRRLIAELAVPELSALAAPLLELERDAEAALAQAFERLITAPANERAPLVRNVRARAALVASTSTEFARELAWVERLHDLYPGDIGVVLSLLLNLVELAPFQALYLPAGNLHAYLHGAGVEIMANSDNVLRGGLTKKPINIPELLRVLRFQELDVEPLLPSPIAPRTDALEQLTYEAPADEFQLFCLRVSGRTTLPRSQGPELLLVTEGHLNLQSTATDDTTTCSLTAGSAAFVPACEARLSVEGEATLFRAIVPRTSTQARLGGWNESNST